MLLRKSVLFIFVSCLLTLPLFGQSHDNTAKKPRVIVVGVNGMEFGRSALLLKGQLPNLAKYGHYSRISSQR
jgi:hypothetical protein